MLPESFFESDPVDVARALIGVRLVVHHPERGRLTGIIVETEAYRGEEDRACHARAGRTARTEPLYGPPGHAYVYLIYGMYQMLNITAWPPGQPAAVLIRGVEPESDGLAATHGPGRLTRAFGIGPQHNTLPFSGHPLDLELVDSVSAREIASSPRIGIDYAGEWAGRRWRFYVPGNRWVSPVRSAARGKKR